MFSGMGTASAHMLGSDGDLNLGLLISGGTNFDTQIKTTSGWHHLTYTASNSSEGVAYGNSMYVITSLNSAVSPFGLRILDSTFPSPSFGTITPSLPAGFNSVNVQFCNGVFVSDSENTAGSNDIVAYSTNGTSWTSVIIDPNTGGLGATRVFATSSNFFATYDNDTGPGGVKISSNGSSWSLLGTVPTATFYDISTANDTVFLSPGFPSTDIFISTDEGSTWTTVTTNVSGILPYQYANGVYISQFNYSGGATSSYYTSTDGYTWTARTTTYKLVVAVSKDNAFKAVNNTGTVIYKSLDGVTWRISGTCPGTVGQPTVMSYGQY